MNFDYGRIIPGNPIAGQATTAGPGAAGTSLFNQNVAAALAAGALATGGGLFQVQLDLNEAEIKANVSYPVLTGEAGKVHRVVSAFAILMRASAVAFSTNRTYQIQYNIAAGVQNALSSAFAFTLTGTSPNNIFTQVIMEGERQTSLGGSTLLSALGEFEGADLIWAPTAGGTIANGGAAQLRVVFSIQTLTFPTRVV